MVDEAEIIRGLINGDETAIELIIGHLGSRLLRSATAITGDIHIAEEVVQDTFIQVIRKINTFQEGSSLESWVFRIAMNLAKNRLRGWWFHKVSTGITEGQSIVTYNNASFSPEGSIITSETRQEVMSCLQHLPMKYREVIVLYYLEDLSINQISSVLNQPEGTIKSKLSRARKLLKAEIEGRGLVF